MSWAKAPLYPIQKQEVASILSDEIAYQKYLKGDNSAASLLVERYGDSLTLYINQYIKDLSDAEDLMIEAFSQLFSKERPITEKGNFKAYLYKVARNLSLRHIHKCRIRFLNIGELTFDLPDDLLTETQLIKNERNHQLYDALKKLKPEYREALYLIYFEDMSYRDAAIAMSKNERQITNLVHRGKHRLKNILEQEGFLYADV